jgi:Tfp pilus assembly protein PilO
MRAQLRQQSYGVIGLVLIVAIGFPLGIFLPRMKAIARIRQEIKQKQDFVTQTEKLRPLVTQQRESLAWASEYVETQRGRLVAPAELSQVYSKISKLSKEVGATTTRFQPRPPVLYDSFRMVPLELGVRGSAETIQQLLAQVEQLPCTIWLDGVKCEATGEDGSTARCAIELGIFVDNREISD